MSKREFCCDKQWWFSISDTEKERWLDWAESFGAERKTKFMDRNPRYPDLECMPGLYFNENDIEMDFLK